MQNQNHKDRLDAWLELFHKPVPPPENCDICHTPFARHGVYYDAKLKAGPWGNLCGPCFKSHGIGLGMGKGQVFVRLYNGNWVKQA